MLLESLEQHWIFHLLISGALLTILLLSFHRINLTDLQQRRRIILGTGLFALFVGLLAFPIETIDMMEAMSQAEQRKTVFALVRGGFYLPFIPLVYGIFCFVISLMGWKFLKRNTEV